MKLEQQVVKLSTIKLGNMLKLEQQVCSLELAKRLKELNVKQESFFIWKQCINKQLACYQIPTVSTHKNVDNDDEIIASAFTVAELGEMLPAGMKSGKRIVIQTGKIQESVDRWNCYCQGLFPDLSPWAFNKTADTEADARCLMLIYLLENKLITL